MANQLSTELAENLRSINPWWRALPGKPVPAFRRWPYKRLRQMLDAGIAPATVLRGPRRVGKTVLLLQLIEALLAEGVQGTRILYVPFDELPTFGDSREPVLAICRWFEDQVLGSSFNVAARRKQPAYVFLDEVQNLNAWAPQLKSLVDNHALRAFVTGSSSLRIEAGRDSLAGRISTLEMGPLLLREIAELGFGNRIAPLWVDNGLDAWATREFWQEAVERGRVEQPARAQAFRAFAARGAYPMAHEEPGTPWPRLADFLNETVVRRAIQHDLRLGSRGRLRDERLLAEVFRLCCRYAGQAVSQKEFVSQIAQALGGGVTSDRILKYLSFLDATLLIRLIPPLELRLKKPTAPAKICLCDHALRASWLQETIPLDPEGLAAKPDLAVLAGHLAESVLGYFLASVPSLDVAHFPARPTEPEVDFVLTIGTRRIPVEVKYRKSIDPHADTSGLRAFLEKVVYNAPFGLLVTLADDVAVTDPRILPISLSSLLWIR